MNERICVGAISGAFGVHGEVRLKSFCADPAAIADYAPLSDEAGLRDFNIAALRPARGGFAARLKGVATREAAEALRGTLLFAERAQLPSLPDDEFYHADLLGLKVVMVEGGAEVGTVKAIIPAGATEVLEIDRGPGEYTLLVPFTRAVVPEIDIKAGWLSIDPPGETEEERDTVSGDEISDGERPNEAENEAEEDNRKKD